MGYTIYLGTQADLLICDLLDRPSECGKNNKFYSYIVVLLFFPVFCLPDLKKISVFNSFALICSLIAFVAIFSFEIKAIYNRSEGNDNDFTFQDEFGTVITPTEEH